MPPIVLFICDSPQLRCAWRRGAARRPRFSFELVEIAETRTLVAVEQLEDVQRADTARF